MSQIAHEIMRRCLGAAVGLGATAGVAWAGTPTVETLTGYILANLVGSPVGTRTHWSPEWCYESGADQRQNAWDYLDPLSGSHATAQVWNAFAIRFTFQEYAGDGSDLPFGFGDIVVG